MPGSSPYNFLPSAHEKNHNSGLEAAGRLAGGAFAPGLAGDSG